ncbi:hypothetical protein VTI74DRAFT_4935 [Chaetomium olivicolor]
MAATFPNEYIHRKVAQASAKACDVCFKLTTSVLITPDNADWFYVCALHLKDTAFCTPKIDQATVEARKERELRQEMERIKKEYEEKQKKKEKEAKDDQKDESKDNKSVQESKEIPEKTEPKKEDAESSPPEEEEPRIFELKSMFYQSRVMRKRDAEIRRRNREKLQDPKYFPSVPKNLPS